MAKLRSTGTHILSARDKVSLRAVARNSQILSIAPPNARGAKASESETMKSKTNGTIRGVRILTALSAFVLIGLTASPVALAATETQPTPSAMDVCVPLTNICIDTICIIGTNICILCQSDCPEGESSRRNW